MCLAIQSAFYGCGVKVGVGTAMVLLEVPVEEAIYQVEVFTTSGLSDYGVTRSSVFVSNTISTKLKKVASLILASESIPCEEARLYRNTVVWAMFVVVAGF